MTQSPTYGVGKGRAAKPPPLDPAVLRVIEALARANARRDYRLAESRKA